MKFLATRVARTAGWRAMVSASPILPARSKARGLVVVNETTAEKLKRAKGYPYARPSTSYIFCNGQAYTFNDSDWVTPGSWGGSLQHLLQLQVTAPDGTSTSMQSVIQALGVKDSVLTGSTPLTPILAIGSNAGPEQLARKFPVDMFPDGVVVPVIQCVLQDFDVVYAPLISSYGSATATLEHSPGTSVSVFITYLTPVLQQRMHETEGAYNLCRLDDVQLLEGIALQQHIEGSGQPVAVQHTVYQYNHQDGTLHLPFSNPGSSPVALAEIPAHGRAFPALPQVQMQAALRQALRGVTVDQLPGSGAAGSGMVHELQTVPSLHSHSPGDDPASGPEDLDDWILTNLNQPTLRRVRVAALSSSAVPFQYERCEVLMVIGTRLSANVK